MNDYKTAFTLAENMHDSLYMWRINNYIGGIFDRQLYNKEALDIYRKSVSLANSNEDKASNYIDIAKLHYSLDNDDSVLYYTKRVVDMAEQFDDKSFQSQIYQNAHVFYSECGYQELAWKYLKMAYETNTDASEGKRFQLNFLDLYLEDENIDSARVYVNMLKNTYNDVDENFLKIAICESVAKYYAEIDMCDSAMYFKHEVVWLCQEIYKDYIEENIYEIQKKYDYEKMNGEYQRSLLKKQRVIIILITLVMIITAGFLFSINNRRKKESYLLNELNRYENEYFRLNKLHEEQEHKIKEQEERIRNYSGSQEDVARLQKELNDYKGKMEETAVSLRKNMQWRCMLVYSISSMENDSRYDAEKRFKKLKENFYGDDKTSFEAIVSIFDEVYPGMSVEIRKKYPMLNETEYKVCIMSFLPFSSKETTIILGQSVNTINVARSSIRKKLDIKGDIAEAIMNFDVSCQPPVVSRD